MTTPIVDEHRLSHDPSRLVYGYEVRTVGKPLIDRTHDVQIRYGNTRHSYQDVLNHAECCPPYNTFDCSFYSDCP